MSTFWLTKQTVQAQLGSTYQAFKLFGSTHLFWLALCIAVCVVGCLAYMRMDERQRRRTLIVLTVLLLADEIFKYAVTLATDQFLWQFLPFHLCSVNIFVCLWYTVRPNKLAAEILYALCLPGAVVALIVPTWTALPMWNFMHLHSSTIHIVLVLYPCLLLSGGFRPQVKRLPKVFAFFALACIPAYALNTLLGTNFMFLNGTDNNPALIFIKNVFGDAYILGLGLGVIAMWAIIYLPWELLNAAGRRKTVNA